jgi:hypothetical protein
MGTEGVGESCRDMALTNLASDAVTLESMVARLNIEHYRKVLSEEIDQTKRQTLLQLIAEEKAKLSALLPSSVMQQNILLARNERANRSRQDK